MTNPEHLPSTLYIVADKETGSVLTGSGNTKIRCFSRREQAEKSIYLLQKRGQENLAIFEYGPWEYEYES